ncbi:MAG TPA: 3-phosphoshikimate 1-carboxyvinyltransferase [Alphaproteobacteria bacterium]|nr:3-phosphoshikimate 1-carboxyvinyltransferase [Alphaproteobacteria bacterium]USO05309.1 MAG: 3-phosphoshikimate 1-carboxyvinyltransferase [Rhodospirillales bacterium]HOO81218.1 3-phosphoshikimate 1-carboxyvinyltransferase [Alphaproteobacteria bacterium]
MNALISHKTKILTGRPRIPGDKSISHRALMFGALTIGETMISGLLEGEDVLCTAQAMRGLGAKIEKSPDGLWRTYGVGIGNLQTPAAPLEMGNSGTSTRLLIGLVGGHPIKATFTGDASLSKRPMRRVITPLEMMGAGIEATDGDKLPLTVTGPEDTLAIEYRLPVASAQVKSAILLAGLNARGTTTVIEEKPTRDHTEKMLTAFGIDVQIETLENGASAISILGQQELQPGAVDVPADPSSAAFPAVAAVLHEGSEITLANIAISTRRNGLYLTLQDMGADITFENKRLQAGEEVANIIVRGNGALKGIDVDPARVPSMIDEFPILAMAASCANGTTKMTGLAELRVKESDRLLMVAEGLKTCGVNLEMGEDWLTIHGTGKPPKGGATIQTALDHRIAMSFLVLGSVTDEPISIDDGTPIATSFPNFVKLMNELGCDIKVL